MTGPVNVHIEEINAALIRLRLEPTDVLVVKLPDASVDLLRVIQRAVVDIVVAAGLPNQVMAVPADWEFEAVSQAQLVGVEATEETVQALQVALDRAGAEPRVVLRPRQWGYPVG